MSLSSKHGGIPREQMSPAWCMGVHCCCVGLTGGQPVDDRGVTSGADDVALVISGDAMSSQGRAAAGRMCSECHH